MARKIITIDGPAGAGKGTAASLLAKKLKCPKISIGDIYRTVAFFCIKEGIKWEDTKSIKNILKNLTFEYNNRNQVVANNKNVEKKIRDPLIAEAVASGLTFNSDAKKAVINYYKNLHKNAPVIIYEGREAGSTAFPKAHAKFYITASTEVRAKHAIQRDIKNGLPKRSLKAKITEIQKRDRHDKAKSKIGQLKIAPGAHKIIATKNTPEEVVEKMIAKL